jgi:tRNA threonylcarbamoyladenosine biosynthesis protein TsaB
VKVLGFDTATSTAGIAIVDDDRVLAATRHETSGRGADLLVAIDDVCRRAGVAPTELDAIAIGAGPGSFTGLRIGMATAKGIAFAARRPLWAVSSLAALADDAARHIAASKRREPEPEARVVIVAALDARRGEVFAGCFCDGIVLAPERVLAPEELAAWVETVSATITSDDAASSPAVADAIERTSPARAVIHFAGDALKVHAALAPLAERWLAIATPSGEAVARRALAGTREDVLLHGAPSYIRPSEAEVKYPDGVPGALRRR